MITRVEICWIFILRNPQIANAKLRAYYCSDDSLNNFLLSNGEEIIYYRRFDNVVDALAHKRYLEEVSSFSLRMIISAMNPREKNLRPIIEQMVN